MGWSTGIKMMASKFTAKKLAPTTMGPPKSGSAPTFPSANKHSTFSKPVLAPVIDLKSKRNNVEDSSPISGTKTQFSKPERVSSKPGGPIGIQSFNEPNFEVANEYDPRWPNDYHKVIQDIRSDKKKDEDLDASDSKKRRYTEDGRAKARERFSRDEAGGGSEDQGAPPVNPGFGRRPRDEYDDEDEEDADRRRKLASTRRTSGCKRLLPGGVRVAASTLTSIASTTLLLLLLEFLLDFLRHFRSPIESNFKKIRQIASLQP